MSGLTRAERKAQHPRMSEMSIEMHTFIVGEERRPYIVHKDLICHYSDYFRAALKGNFIEATRTTTELPTVTTGYFSVFVDWLYQQKIMLSTKIYYDKVPANYTKLVELYIFADTYDTFGLRADALQEFHFLHHRSGTLPPSSVVTEAFEQLSDNSPLLDYIVDIFTLRYELNGLCHAQDRMACLEIMPPRFTARLIMAYCACLSSHMAVPEDGAQLPISWSEDLAKRYWESTQADKEGLKTAKKEFPWWWELQDSI